MSDENPFDNLANSAREMVQAIDDLEARAREGDVDARRELARVGGKALLKLRYDMCIAVQNYLGPPCKNFEPDTEREGDPLPNFCRHCGNHTLHH